MSVQWNLDLAKGFFFGEYCSLNDASPLSTCCRTVQQRLDAAINLTFSNACDAGQQYASCAVLLVGAKSVCKVRLLRALQQHLDIAVNLTLAIPFPAGQQNSRTRMLSASITSIIWSEIDHYTEMLPYCTATHIKRGKHYYSIMFIIIHYCSVKTLLLWVFHFNSPLPPPLASPQRTTTTTTTASRTPRTTTTRWTRITRETSTTTRSEEKGANPKKKKITVLI